MTYRSRPDVVVIGAGVIGLTTAITLAEAGQRVLVRTADPVEDTTSAAAGALWGPWMAEPAQQAGMWAERTLAALTRLADQSGTGVRLATGMDVSPTEHNPPDWFTLLQDLRPCRADELPSGYEYGVHYRAPLIDMPVHLRYLANRLRAADGELVIDEVKTIEEAAESVPVVVNCSALGARALVSDTSVYPVRGQHVVVTNPGLTDFLEVDTGESPDLVAIYPHDDHVVLGGTAEANRWDREPDPSISDEILDRCARLVPKLRDVQVIGHRVGLRPTRPQVRLELEARTDGGALVHNYGHGGAGVSLAWGCAAAAYELIIESKYWHSSARR